MSFDSILFDLDGTLWDSVDEIVATWNTVIERHPGLRAPITRAEQESVMGLQMDEIAKKLFPTEPPDRQMALMEECVQEENRYLEEYGGTLYPDVAATLECLHQKYKLFIVSNCQCGYIEAFLKAHKLADHFDGFLCYGETKKGKGENIKQVVAQFALKHPVYVGDTIGDQKSAQYAGIPFIYASYGFGNADNFDTKIDSFHELCAVMTMFDTFKWISPFLRLGDGQVDLERPQSLREALEQENRRHNQTLGDIVNKSKNRE